MLAPCISQSKKGLLCPAGFMAVASNVCGTSTKDRHSSLTLTIVGKISSLCPVLGWALPFPGGGHVSSEDSVDIACQQGKGRIAGGVWGTDEEALGREYRVMVLALHRANPRSVPSTLYGPMIVARHDP